jgi:hypothetical protein
LSNDSDDRSTGTNLLESLAPNEYTTITAMGAMKNIAYQRNDGTARPHLGPRLPRFVGACAAAVTAVMRLSRRPWP